MNSNERRKKRIDNLDMIVIVAVVAAMTIAASDDNQVLQEAVVEEITEEAGAMVVPLEMITEEILVETVVEIDIIALAAIVEVSDTDSL